MPVRVKVKLTEDYEPTIMKLITTQLNLADMVGPEKKKEVLKELGYLGITVVDKGERVNEVFRLIFRDWRF